MGTIADLVPLLGENRILAKTGLRILQETARPGLRALMDVSGISGAQVIQPVDISFRLGPRINASGRLADAALSVDLLLSDDADFARETAQQLDTFNRERQDIERKITEEAERMIEERYISDSGIVLFSEAWHPGVVGIVAGRVTRGRGDRGGPGHPALQPAVHRARQRGRHGEGLRAQRGRHGKDRKSVG